MAGNQKLAAPEGDLLETLQLLCGRAALPPPSAETPADGVRCSQTGPGPASPKRPPDCLRSLLGLLFAALTVTSCREPLPRSAACSCAGAGRRPAPQPVNPKPCPASGRARGRPALQAPPWLAADHPLAQVEGSLRHGGPCGACAALARLLVVTPCAHLLCTACARPARREAHQSPASTPRPHTPPPSRHVAPPSRYCMHLPSPTCTPLAKDAVGMMEVEASMKR